MLRVRRAFTLIELLVVIAIISLLMSILLPALASARRTARQSLCSSNMQQIGRAQFAYGADFREYIAAFSGLPELTGVDAGEGIHGLYFATEQAKYILAQYGKTALGFNSIQGKNLKTVTEEHSHLVLTSYMGDKLPVMATVCPEDRSRLDWQRNPGRINQSVYKPRLPYNGAVISWLPYSSSYQLLPAGWLQDKAPPPSGPWTPFSQNQIHNLYDYNKGEPIGRRRIADVTFASQKVAVADTQQRHFGKDVYYAFVDARQPLLFWDASVSVRRTGDGNRGWNRDVPRGSDSMAFTYTPDLGFESAPPPGSLTETTAKIDAGYYKWTRGGLKGLDFGGKEIDTSKW